MFSCLSLFWIRNPKWRGHLFFSSSNNEIQTPFPRIFSEAHYGSHGLHSEHLKTVNEMVSINGNASCSRNLSTDIYMFPNPGHLTSAGLASVNNIYRLLLRDQELRETRPSWKMVQCLCIPIEGRIKGCGT